MFRLHCLFLTLFLSFQIPQISLAAPTEGTPAIAAPESAKIETVFLGGLADLEQGNAQSAIGKFSSILAIDPNLVRVRLELGFAYFIARQWDRARNEFFTALSGDLPDPVRSKVLGLIREIDARRGFDWDLSLGLTDVGNQRDYDTDQIVLDFAGLNLPFRLNREKSSEIGMRVTGGRKLPSTSKLQSFWG
ncbi:tetratricopeptide repeat protein [uncultured Ruegeria sp.]|uniref:tetratricopeptide repeat protein n=1 Tax=uncultured Ruegeria sp. TaxID=259304 RepID=UPI00345C0EEC